MGRVIKALNNGENALLESFTGTGKTLSLLCATLAWLRSEREKLDKTEGYQLPQIIYSSRTHS
jgi:regulator of telomere elongation helicase 1